MTGVQLSVVIRNPNQPPGGRWLTTREASERLSVAAETLRRWARRREQGEDVGPLFTVVEGLRRYRESDVDTYAEARKSKRKSASSEGLAS